MIRLWLMMALLGGLVAAPGCKPDDMANQLRYKPLAPSAFYPDGASARLPVEHTVDRDGIVAEDWSTGKSPRSAGSAAHWQFVTSATRYPFPITRQDLERGRQVFEIQCSECHGLLGDGDGMVPQRGFTRPPSYHSDRLRQAPPAYFYDVITNGIGAMFPYGQRVTPDDRWRIAAYIRALQLSQFAAVQDLPAEDRARINTPPEAAR